MLPRLLLKLKLKTPCSVLPQGVEITLGNLIHPYSAQRKTAFLLKAKMLKLNIKRALFILLADIILRLLNYLYGAL
jgi:hypothetical protein